MAKKISQRKRDEILQDTFSRLSAKCKCGHTVTFYRYNTKKKICSHCGHYVYRNKQAEFIEKMEEMLKG